MPELEKNDFKFPDEMEQNSAESENSVEIEIEDDTPAIDRNRNAVSAEEVKKIEVETDELDAYSQQAKEKIVKMKHIWHDERRAKEAALREQQEAIALAQKLLAENERIKKMLQSGEQEYKEAKKDSAKSAVKEAKQMLKTAYEVGVHA